jgi:pimeloyl-ACP methyl ester carboxylesterase
MDIILVPGLWLDASSWDPVLPALRSAGHTPHALTMPGVGAVADESRDIGIADWVHAVVEEIDRAQHPVVLVGHSGGGNVVWGAADARPDRVARVVLVDTMPPPPGAMISEFDVVDGVVPFPGWSTFDAPDVADLDEEMRAKMTAQARSVPARVPTDAIALGDDRRYVVPVTVLSGPFEEPELREMVSEWGSWAAEFERIESVEVIRLGTGHWPQFSAPDALATAMVSALEK